MIIRMPEVILEDHLGEIMVALTPITITTTTTTTIKEVDTEGEEDIEAEVVVKEEDIVGEEVEAGDIVVEAEEDIVAVVAAVADTRTTATMKIPMHVS